MNFKLNVKMILIFVVEQYTQHYKESKSQNSYVKNYYEQSEYLLALVKLRIKSDYNQ